MHLVLPLPGSGGGIKFPDYMRTLVYHFSDGGRFLEEIQTLKEDTGFRNVNGSCMLINTWIKYVRSFV